MRGAEQVTAQWRDSSGEIEFADAIAKALCQQIGINTFTTQSVSETGIIVFTAAQIMNAVENMPGLVRAMCEQPFFE